MISNIVREFDRVAKKMPRASSMTKWVRLTRTKIYWLIQMLSRLGSTKKNRS